jgi:hypothetical protein
VFTDLEGAALSKRDVTSSLMDALERGTWSSRSVYRPEMDSSNTPNSNDQVRFELAYYTSMYVPPISQDTFLTSTPVNPAIKGVFSLLRPLMVPSENRLTLILPTSDRALA